MGLIALADEPFSIAHIIYLIINIIWFIVGIILIKKKVKNEKTLELIIRISGAALLFCVISMRIADVILDIKADPETNKWYHVFPYSYCAFSNITLGFAALFYKKDNIVFHFAVYMSLYGGVLSTIYPEYLSHDHFFTYVGMTSLLHHSISIWICLIILTNKLFTPEYKKILAYIIGFGIMLLIGVFELFVLKYPSAMNLDKPLSDDIGPITSWYVLVIAGTLVTLLFIFILKKLYNRKESTNNNTAQIENEK